MLSHTTTKYALTKNYVYVAIIATKLLIWNHATTE